jgi:catechol 2,3-dioxygenase-like lactoylglutathione lyase family enzyme
VEDIAGAVEFFQGRFGFEAIHVADAFAVLIRDDARIHLWKADDQSWRERTDLSRRPIVSGAESFLAGTASCRIEVVDIDALYAELAATEVLHPTARAGVTETDFGSREFACLDRDGNLVEFFRWTDSPTT